MWESKKLYYFKKDKEPYSTYLTYRKKSNKDNIYAIHYLFTLSNLS